MPKNIETTTQLHSSHMLAKWCSKLSMLGFNSIWTKKIQMFNLGLEKSEGQEIKLTMIKEKAREFHRNVYLCFFDKAKALDSMGHNKV